LPTILLINDDGIRSAGLLALKNQMESLGKVTIVAPRDEKSGIGKALTASGRVKVTETRLEDGFVAYAITGTPADAFLLALNKILKRPPDLLVAGINLGPNLGVEDLLNSGTLGAALEAALHGVPAIAISYCMREVRGKEEVTLEELEPTALLARRVAEYVLERGMPPQVDIISMNVPEKADTRRVKVTRLSYKGYGDIHKKQRNGYSIMGWTLAGYPDDAPGTDVYTIKKENCVSLTPIKIRFYHNKRTLEGIKTHILLNLNDVSVRI